MQEACAISIRRLYGYGCSEHVFGHALRTLDRDSLVHSSKVGRRMSPKADNDDVPGWRKGGLSFKPTFDYSREGTLRSFEQSPLRLGLNRIDIALIHDVDVWTQGTQQVAEPAALTARQLYPLFRDFNVSTSSYSSVRLESSSLRKLKPCLH